MQLQVEITNRQILRIALPIAVSILVPNINFITNNIFLGHLSEQALAIAGITGVYYLVFGVMGFGLSSGLQAVMSRRAGENRAQKRRGGAPPQAGAPASESGPLPIARRGRPERRSALTPRRTPTHGRRMQGPLATAPRTEWHRPPT